ncbi:competence type IV pilus ATPase ComGA [Levilactobacillus acidifarinae]|uniref:Type II secretory pathway competence component, ATPase n=1 Tax=Levilactobacillus acidifarinae DSM 19394 = JCM 15949 TaxID=1423715 RepID=A0A0R1LDN0_9LACO|nr:competence type IV pilus ATPase ComGA [Levilactobacillus acidifarinae]KRK93711.1 Type II secretory pathway competence component, ATPase [Levilactobacillus acidifarinae DSM 19394]GEO70699.1 secretion protein E [Levilactobacillus acidifarinae]
MPIQALINDLLQTAQQQRVSDIYVLPQQTGYRVQLRQTQRMQTWRILAADVGQQLLTYFKFHANMAVSEHRRPQVGALTWELPNGHLELRFSTVGDYAGHESLVIRLIYPYQDLALDYLDPPQKQQLGQLATQRGLMLFAGPTGAGKTTTMYTTARQLATDALVLTIEDPVEIKEPRFVQLQVNVPAGMAYGDLIKVGLRHRPDAFIIGEIRDGVTAQAAVRAALSGHLVLSTIHARSAAGTIDRLLDLGVAADQLRQVLTAACYQRLIPRTPHGTAVLLAILTGPALWQPTGQTQERWRKTLERAHAAGTITAQTLATYAAG